MCRGLGPALDPSWVVPDHAACGVLVRYQGRWLLACSCKSCADTVRQLMQCTCGDGSLHTDSRVGFRVLPGCSAHREVLAPCQLLCIWATDEQVKRVHNGGCVLLQALAYVLQEELLLAQAFHGDCTAAVRQLPQGVHTFCALGVSRQQEPRPHSRRGLPQSSSGRPLQHHEQHHANHGRHASIGQVRQPSDSACG
jgi:hypothetical protein